MLQGKCFRSETARGKHFGRLTFDPVALPGNILLRPACFKAGIPSPGFDPLLRDHGINYGAFTHSSRRVNRILFA